MNKKEAKAQVILSAYFREKKIYGFFELKQTETDNFRLSKIERTQYEGLQATEKSGLVWKLSDEDSRPKPCDTLSIPPLPSYLVIKFKDGFYIVRFQKFVDLRDEGVISVSRAEVERMAEKIIKTQHAKRKTDEED